MKKVIVVSLGGSLIIPDKIDIKFLKELKKVIKKNTKKYKFVIVCGGGSTAREYIKGLEKEKLKKKLFHQGLLGIATTRLNARFMTYFFGEDTNKGIPHDMGEVKNMLRLYDVVFCGALRYAKDETSDGTSAKLAKFFNTEFINLTNVIGLYDKDPKELCKSRLPSKAIKEVDKQRRKGRLSEGNRRCPRNAKFIPKITWKDFNKMANAQGFKPGQHFVLDQSASRIIMKYKISTYIIGNNLKNLDNILNNKEFKGTKVSD
tara:strand:+ start:68 stop:850 length:783 start_codon:yes stop_codon:yes gene_type:complete